MARNFEITVLVVIATNLLPIYDARAQDFPDVQTITNRVLFAKEDVAVEKRAIETRRIEALDQRTKIQETLIQEQAASVQKIGGELESLKEERRILELATSFDTTIVARQWSVARSLLADAITVGLQPGSAAGATIVPADAFLADLSKSARTTVLPRSNQQVQLAGDRAVLTSDGLPWRRSGGAGTASDQAGRYEYRFVRTAVGWKIDGLLFHFSE